MRPRHGSSTSITCFTARCSCWLAPTRWRKTPMSAATSSTVQCGRGCRPVYQFKAMIPVAGVLVMLQGAAEIVRCIVCLKTGEWPSRLKDVAEIDVVEEQLAHSEHVDEETRKRAIARAHEIDETARQRGMGGDLQT